MTTQVPKGLSKPTTLKAAIALLYNDTRRDIIVALADGEQDVSTLTKHLELEISAVSHALHELLSAGLVMRRQHKRRHLYRVAAGVKVIMRGTKIVLDVISADGGRVRVWVPERSAETGPA